MRIMIEYIGYKEAGPVIALGIMKGLAENNIDVNAILLDKIENKADFNELFSKDNIYFIKETPSKKRIISSVINTFYELFCIKAKFKNKKYDYLIRIFINPLDDIYSMFIKKNHVVNIIHDPKPHLGTPEKEKKKYINLLKKTKEAIVLTKSFKKQISEEYGIPEDLIYFMRLGKMSTNKQCKKCFYSKNDPINFLFFGRIEEYKGLNVLAEAYSMLNVNYDDDYSLTIAGSGNFNEYTKQYNELKNVILINRYILETEIEKLFIKPNTVVILPYTDASQSGVIPLAFQYGVPVIASKTGGLFEQLFDGEVGLFFNPKDAKSLYNLMIKFIEDKEIWATQAKKMNEYNYRFEWREVTKELLDQFGCED